MSSDCMVWKVLGVFGFKTYLGKVAQEYSDRDCISS